MWTGGPINRHTYISRVLHPLVSTTHARCGFTIARDGAHQPLFLKTVLGISPSFLHHA